MHDNDRHSFIMVAHNNKSHFYRFSNEILSSSTDKFEITINNEKNRFSNDQLIIDLYPKEGDDANESFQMNLKLSSHVIPPDLSWIAPGTMGPYSWVPTMQCYHHVLSMKYDIHGTIRINQSETQTVSGVGYLEKDWGSSFPSTWIWGQANQWENLPATSSASLFFSFALIPWYFNIEFAGFLIIFEHNHEFYRFNTYLQSSIHDLSIDQNTNKISIDIYDVLFEYKLHVSTYCDGIENMNGSMLYGPRNDRMEKFVIEMLTKGIYFDVRLSKLIQNATMNKDDNDLFIQHGYYEDIIFEGRAINVALEITGNVKWLIEKFQEMYEHTYPWNFSLIRSLIQYYKLVFASVISIMIIWLVFGKRR